MLALLDSAALVVQLAPMLLLSCPAPGWQHWQLVAEWLAGCWCTVRRLVAAGNRVRRGAAAAVDGAGAALWARTPPPHHLYCKSVQITTRRARASGATFACMTKGETSQRPHDAPHWCRYNQPHLAHRHSTCHHSVATTMAHVAALQQQDMSVYRGRGASRTKLAA
jgi:hypothetical protein